MRKSPLLQVNVDNQVIILLLGLQAFLPLGIRCFRFASPAIINLSHPVQDFLCLMNQLLRKLEAKFYIFTVTKNLSPIKSYKILNILSENPPIMTNCLTYFTPGGPVLSKAGGGPFALWA